MTTDIEPSTGAPMVATGLGGRLYAGPYLAADLGAWNLQTLPQFGSPTVVEATVRSRDVYWMAHGDRFQLWLCLGANWWIWHEVRVAEHGAGVRVGAEGSPEAREAT